MLGLAQKKIKVLNQLLDRIIPENDSHTMLHANKLNELEVIEETLMTYKIPVKG
jgi:hypothetical protein